MDVRYPPAADNRYRETETISVLEFSYRFLTSLVKTLEPCTDDSFCK